MYEKAHDHLISYGIRPSVQRMAVMDYLLDHPTHPTVDEIFSALASVIPTLSRTTVYNTVSMLAECGAILSLDLEAGQMHYDGDTRPHAHFFCTRCGHIHDILPETEGWGRMIASVPPPPEVSVAVTQLTYKGVCAKCRS